MKKIKVRKDWNQEINMNRLRDMQGKWVCLRKTKSDSDMKNKSRDKDQRERKSEVCVYLCKLKRRSIYKSLYILAFISTKTVPPFLLCILNISRYIWKNKKKSVYKFLFNWFTQQQLLHFDLLSH